MRLPLLVLMLAALLALPAPAGAQVQTFRKEVRQIIGSAQSPDDARAAAVVKAKRDAMEEAGTWLESLSEVRNYALAKDDVTALASGVVHTRIVEEQRFVQGDAFGIRVVAEVTVDNSGLAERIRAFLADRRRMAEAKSNTEREKQLLERLATLERRMAAMQNATEAEKAALRGDVQSNARQLTAQEWFDKASDLWDTKRRRYSDPNQAIAYFSEALRLDTNYAAAYNSRGNASTDLNQYERAIQDYDQALRLDPNYAAAYSNRGNAYHYLKQYERAIQDYDQALRLAPNNAVAYFNRGMVYFGLKQHERAIQDLDQSLRLDPDHANAYYDRGLAHATLGRHERAIQDYDQSLRLDSNNAAAYHIRGVAYAGLRQYERAIRDFDQALRLDRNDANAYAGRGAAHILLGRREQAYRDLRRSCELGTKPVCDYIRQNPE